MGTAAETPECFADLNLDQVVDGLTLGGDSYELRPFFSTVAHSIEQTSTSRSSAAPAPPGDQCS